jgi:hypothetical protein
MMQQTTNLTPFAKLFFMYMNNFVHDEIVGKRGNNMM